MEDKDTRCIPLDGLVVVPLDEFRNLVYEEARNDIVRHLLLNEKTAYIDTNTIRIAMGLNPIIHYQPADIEPSKEKTDE